MKKVIVFKCSRNPQDARVSASGDIMWNGAKAAASDDDPAAMEIVKALADEQDIVGITTGDGKSDWAAARGAASTIVIEDVTAETDGLVAAKAVAAAVKSLGDVDVVAIGDSDWDRTIATALIGQLQWPTYANVTEVECQGESYRLTCKTAEGMQIVETKAPVLICAKALSKEANVPGMKQTLAARKKPVEKVSTSSLGIATEAKAKVMGTRLPEGAACTIIDGADPAAACEKLLAALRDDGVLK